MSKLTDEQLLKRASHASRNLGVLATLASLLALTFGAIGFLVKGSPAFLGVMGLTTAIMAAAYWVLMVAAKRGNPASVTGAMVVMVIQMVLVLISMGLQGRRTENGPEMAGSNGFGFVVGLVVLYALHTSRSVLIELKERGLWDGVFAAAKPSGQLCVVGNVLLAVGLVSMVAAGIVLGAASAREQLADRGRAQVFRTILTVDEKSFMEALKKASNPADPTGAETARADMWKQLKNLQEKVASARQQAAGDEQLLSILNTYASAVDQWQKGLETMTTEGGDAAKGQLLLQNGDQLRGNAIREFDRAYAGPLKPAM